MRVVGEFNNISKELKEKIVPLKPGQFAEYQLLEKVTTSDPTTRVKTVTFPHRMWYAQDSIFDPFKATTVDIGVIAKNGEDVKNKTVTLCEKFEVDNPRDGILYLDGNIVLHRDLHEFLQVCNFVDGTVLGDDRDTSKQLVLRLIDRKKEAKARNKKFDQRADAIVFVRNMDAQEQRDFAAGMNWDFEGDLDQIEEKIKEFADKEPETFTRSVTDQNFKKKVIIRKAMGHHITFDHAGYRVLWKNGSVLATLERKEGQNEIDVFADWLSTVANGDKILAQIKAPKRSAAVAS